MLGRNKVQIFCCHTPSVSTAVSLFCKNVMHQMGTTAKNVTVYKTRRTVVNKNISILGMCALTHIYTVIINKLPYSFRTVC